MPKTTPTTDRPPAGEYPILPAANRHWLTPLYDLLCELMGLGRRFQRGVLARLGLRREERLIDVGCGSGTLLAETLRGYRGVTAAGVDADPEILATARRLRRYGARVTLHAARAEAIPFPDGSFDAAVSTLTFHHLPTPAKRAALAEVYRVLRPGGRLLLVDFGARPARALVGGAVRNGGIPGGQRPGIAPGVCGGRRVRGRASDPPPVAGGRVPRGREAGSARAG